MTTETPPQPSASGGDGLLAIVAAATMIIAAVEAAFIPWATWALLPFILLMLIIAAIGVVWAVGRLIDSE